MEVTIGDNSIPRYVPASKLTNINFRFLEYHRAPVSERRLPQTASVCCPRPRCPGWRV